MKNKKLKLSIILLFGLLFKVVNAQQTIPASSGNAMGNEGNASYTVGQIFYVANFGTTFSEVQGVQQPFEIYIITGIEEIRNVDLIYSAYPNPATDFLTLKIEGEIPTQCFSSLYDINGKLLENKQLTDNETCISMDNLVPATYFLKVIANNKKEKTFKIIKN